MIMEKPWWMKKHEPATEYEEDYDVSGTYYGEKKDDVENGYDNFEDGDVSEVGVSISAEAAKAIARASEPLKKLVFSPKDCQDSTYIVDGLKDGRVVVVCVENLDRENFLRLFDYVMGAVHALDGKFLRVDRDTVHILPYGVEEDVNVEELEEIELEISEETADKE